MALSHTAVLRLYNIVMEDVISGIRETFLDDGVDEQVLQELRQLWESKLLASKAVEQTPDPPELHPPPIVTNNLKANGAIKKAPAMEQQSSTNTQVALNTQQANSTSNLVNQQGASNNQAQTNIVNIDPNGKVPVQLTLPAQAGVPGSTQRVFTLQIPASALHNNQLHQVLTGPIITATMNLPQNLAATLLQQHINAALSGQQSSLNNPTTNTLSVARSQLDGGGYDSSDDEISDGGGGGAGPSDDDADAAGSGVGTDGGLDDEDGEEGEEGGAEDEPLNSGDDVSEEDPSDMFDTDNVVVCQYDKITRSRNKWKFYLKDGIMNLSGKDYIFQKANGDAEW
ncbi:transcription factor IIA L [Arctopsyche grandis]|uniref:transcription factor IIA L n=1 Tax=Arctopsyche grandis TaxID=121162 RepID=UPI00406D7B59